MKILKNFKNFIKFNRNGILSSKTYEEITNDLKFKKDKIVNKLNLVSEMNLKF